MTDTTTKTPAPTAPAKPAPRVIPSSGVPSVQPAAKASAPTEQPVGTSAPTAVPAGAEAATPSDFGILTRDVRTLGTDVGEDLVAAAKAASAKLDAETASIGKSAQGLWSKALDKVRGWSTKTWVYIAVGICAVLAITYGSTAKKPELSSVRFWANSQDIDARVTAAKTDVEKRIEDAKKSSNTRIDSLGASAAKQADLESLRSQVAELNARLTAVEERSSSNPRSPAQKRRRR